MSNLPDDWKIVTLGELGAFRNGANFNRKQYGKGLSVINVKNLYQSRYVSINDLDEIKLGTLSNPNSVAVQKGDILFARSSVKASGAGQAAMVNSYKDGTIFSGFIIRFRLNQHNQIIPEYLNYLVRSPEYREILTRIGTGTSITNLTQEQLSQLSIKLPPLPEQKAIASILSSLDDKIELNQQMNQTLEAMARAIFKSWFVDFEPVRAKMEGKQPVGMDTATANLFPDSFEESELGLIPKGWSVKRIDEVVNLNCNSIKKNYLYETIEYIDISSVTVGRLEETTTYQLSNAPSRAKRLVSHGDTIWSGVRPNRKSYLFIHNPLPNLVVSTGFIVLTPKLIPPSYLYSWVTTEDFVYYLTLNADGSAYPAVRVNHFAEALILIPPDNILQTFEKNVSVFHDKISNNQNESRTLANIRDTLLPKLMSGEIRVKEAETMIEKVV